MAVFDKAARFFNGHFSDLDVPFWRFVKGGRDDFPFDAADHVGDFFRTLVDQKDDQDDFGIVGCDRVGDILQDDRFSGAGRSDDECPLPFADGSCKSRTRVVIFSLVVSITRRLSRIKRSQVFKENAVACFFWRFVVDFFDFEKSKIFFFLFGRADGSVDGIPFFQIESADLCRRDVNIFCRREVVVVGRAEESKSIGKDFEDAFADENFVGLF